jgi:hypothetical protein
MFQHSYLEKKEKEEIERKKERKQQMLHLYLSKLPYRMSCASIKLSVAKVAPIVHARSFVYFYNWLTF